jgi:hypothetical protein
MNESDYHEVEGNSKSKSDQFVGFPLIIGNLFTFRCVDSHFFSTSNFLNSSELN